MREGEGEGVGKEEGGEEGQMEELETLTYLAKDSG